jgi:hypothetical protein
LSPGPSSHRTAACAALLIGRDDATVKDAVGRLRGGVAALVVLPWRRWVCCRRSTPRSPRRLRARSSMQGNPVRLSEEELAAVL